MKKTLATLVSSVTLFATANAQVVDTFDITGDYVLGTPLVFASGSNSVVMNTTIPTEASSNSFISGNELAFRNTTADPLATFATSLTFTNAISNLTLSLEDFDPNDFILNLSHNPSSATSGFSIDAPNNSVTGSGTQIGTITWDFATPITSLTFDVQTGPGAGWAIALGSVTSTPVPEPSSTLLLGLAALSFIGRRKRV